MGLDVFGRIRDIVAANVDDLLSRAEDPEKMADQMVRRYEEAIRDLLESTAAIMASSKEAGAKLKACEAEIVKYAGYAKRALTDGNEEKARQAIRLKQEQEALRPTLEESYRTVKEQADRAENDYRKLAAGLEQTKARAEAMKNKVKTARVKEAAGEVRLKSASAATGVMNRFDRLEAKADRMLNEAEAKESLLGRSSESAELDALYGQNSDSAVEAELQAMKASMEGGEPSVESVEAELQAMKKGL